MNRYLCSFYLLLSVVCVIGQSEDNSGRALRCKVPTVAPKNIEKVINDCQEEIKVAILAEALNTLNEGRSQVSEDVHNREKRQAFSNDEKRIAGCLLQCVYRRMNVLNKVGFPTMEGLVRLYSENVNDKEYLVATYQSVYTCVNMAKKVHLITPQSIEEVGKTCDIAYDVFDCVSEKIGEYCGQRP